MEGSTNSGPVWRVLTDLPRQRRFRPPRWLVGAWWRTPPRPPWAVLLVAPQEGLLGPPQCFCGISPVENDVLGGLVEVLTVSTDREGDRGDPAVVRYPVRRGDHVLVLWP